MEAQDWEDIKLDRLLGKVTRVVSTEKYNKIKRAKQRRRYIRRIKRIMKQVIKMTLICIGLITLVDNGMPKLYGAYLRLSGSSMLISESKKDECIQQIEQLMQLNNMYYGQKSMSEESQGSLTNYSIKKDKLRLYNTGSYNSSGGMCLGFSMFEKFNYMNVLEDLNKRLPKEIQLSNPSRQDLGSISLDEADDFRLYGGVRLQANTYHNLDAKTQYDIYTRAYRNKKEDFSAKVKNNKAKEILNVINYLQEEANKNKKQYPLTEFKPKTYIDVYSVLYNRKAKDTFEPSLITEKIDANEPVVIGISNVEAGHAVLAYAYDYIEENILKVYVSDSNFTILDEKAKDEERLKNIKQYNHDIKENMYMLCVKDEDTDRWEYIYITLKLMKTMFIKEDITLIYLIQV